MIWRRLIEEDLMRHILISPNIQRSKINKRMMNTFFSNFYYYPLKLYVVITCQLYFRKVRVVGLRNVPVKGPVIYAITHQNSLLDAYLSNGFSWRSPYYLTRADIFKNKIVDKIMRSIKTLPIYRVRDGDDSQKKNEQIFELTKGILSEGGVVAIFPEGSHSLTHKLRPLKKGIARMAFMADAAEDFNLNVQIIPIGINYESYFSSKSRTLVSFGKPIRVADYKQAYLMDQNKAFRELLSELSLQMKSLILHIESKDYDQVYEAFKKQRVFKTNLRKQLKSDQELVHSIEHGKKFEDSSDKQHVIMQLRGNFLKRLRYVAGYIPKSIVNLLVKKLVKDKNYIGTMAFTYSMIVYPVFYTMLYYLILFMVNS